VKCSKERSEENIVVVSAFPRSTRTVAATVAGTARDVRTYEMRASVSGARSSRRASCSRA
jgi:hypothetical protein